jgi:chitodextrinase
VYASTANSYTVRAFDAAGNASQQSPAVIISTPATMDALPPSTPLGLTATALSASHINLSWSASSDNVSVTGYRIFRNGLPHATLGSVTSFQDPALIVGVTYVYTVLARDAAGNESTPSAAASATPLPGLDTTPPSTPTGVAASAISNTQASLAWIASTDNVAVAGYRIYRNGAFLVSVADTTPYLDTGLLSTTTYSYNVDAIDASGNISGLSAAASVTTLATPDTTPPTLPLGLTANAVSSSQVNLSWFDSTDNFAVTGYRVFRGGTLLDTLGNVTSYQAIGLNASTSYSFRVQAFDAAGNLSVLSAAANATTQAVPDTAAPTVPAGLTANPVSSSRINLSWSASMDNVAVTGYRVYRNGAFLIAVGNVTSYQASGLSASTTYTFNVDAIDAAGNASGASSQAIATTLAPNAAVLTWDPVTTIPNATGYRVYYGTASGTYSQAAGAGVNVGNVITHTVTGLASGTRYFFAVTAYDALNESGYSNEVFKDMP